MYPLWKGSRRVWDGGIPLVSIPSFLKSTYTASHSFFVITWMASNHPSSFIPSHANAFSTLSSTQLASSICAHTVVELNKPKSLECLGYSVSWQTDIIDFSALLKEMSNIVMVPSLIQTVHIHCSLYFYHDQWNHVPSTSLVFKTKGTFLLIFVLSLLSSNTCDCSKILVIRSVSVDNCLILVFHNQSASKFHHK